MDYKTLEKARIGSSLIQYWKHNYKRCWICNKDGIFYLVELDGEFHVVLRCSQCIDKSYNIVATLTTQDLFTLKLLKEV